MKIPSYLISVYIYDKYPKFFRWNIKEFSEKAVVGIQSAAGYAEGRPLYTSWKN